MRGGLARSVSSGFSSTRVFGPLLRTDIHSSRPGRTPWTKQVPKSVFSAAYAIAMWCLVFGCIGAFNSLFDGASPTSRYIADSSYWVYLLHLPVLFQIEVLIADTSWGFGGVPKFLFYNIVTVIVCFASYHYLVRSTFIGRVLNGRKYPFVPWFGKWTGAAQLPGDGIPAPKGDFATQPSGPLPHAHVPHKTEPSIPADSRAGREQPDSRSR